MAEAAQTQTCAVDVTAQAETPSVAAQRQIGAVENQQLAFIMVTAAAWQGGRDGARKVLHGQGTDEVEDAGHGVLRRALRLTARGWSEVGADVRASIIARPAAPPASKILAGVVGQT